MVAICPRYDMMRSRSDQADVEGPFQVLHLDFF
jgi:hypothetical protein